MVDKSRHCCSARVRSASVRNDGDGGAAGLGCALSVHEEENIASALLALAPMLSHHQLSRKSSMAVNFAWRSAPASTKGRMPGKCSMVQVAAMVRASSEFAFS